VHPLTFVGLSADGRALIVADSGGTSFRLDIDARLSAALGLAIRPGTASDQGRIRSHGQMEIALHTLSPKDIQARIRAGATVAEVAEQTGEPIERIERFAGPPLADRAHAADQARGTLVRGETATLDDVVSAYVEARGLSLSDVKWDAWRREDGTWTVIAFLPAAAGVEAVASWTFDPSARQVTADDITALRQAPAASTGVGPLRLVVAETQASEAVVETSQPDSGGTPDSSGGDGPPDAVAPPSAEGAREPRSRSKRRASVPTWDEILFGASAPTNGD